MEGAEDFVGALNATNSPLTGLIVGTAIGALVALIFVLLLSFGFRGHGVVSRLVRSTRAQIALLFTTLGAWTGFVLTTPPDPPDWYGHVAHGLLVAVIVVGGWIIYAGMGLLGESEILADVRTGRDIRRFRTQVQITAGMRGGNHSHLCRCPSLGLASHNLALDRVHNKGI